MTLRGSVLEDAIPSTAKHSSARGLPLKEVLEHVVPELSVQCLRLAFNTPKVTEQLMKLDEQGVSSASRENACCRGFLLGFQSTDLHTSLLTGKADAFIVKDILFAIPRFLFLSTLNFAHLMKFSVRTDRFGT